MRPITIALLTTVLTTSLVTTALAQGKSFRLPSVSMKDRIIWGSQSEEPAGGGLAFGGQDQQGDDGNPHTRIKVGDGWVAIHEELWAKNKLQPFHRIISDSAGELRGEVTVLRAAFLGGRFTEAGGQEMAEPALKRWRRSAAAMATAIETHQARRKADLGEYEHQQLSQVIARLKELSAGKLPAHQPAPMTALRDPNRPLPTEKGPHSAWAMLIAELYRMQIALEQAAEWLDAEPPARALSPVVYDAKTKLYVIFGGDHCDYLTNDTWVFDPAKRQWQQRWPAEGRAPMPRGNHKLDARGDGKIVLTGGYTYTSSTDYVGGQYRELNDGDWIYDVAANTWNPGPDKDPTTKAQRPAATPDARVYRTGPHHPDYFLQGPAPDAMGHAERLAKLPENTWVAMNPPQLPQLNRDWGTAVFDPDRDLILRFSGGHSAHGGSDVLHYHLATNRWELPFPVEFPLGQLYDNTEYPEGFNFNRRPWVTGHTYQNYGYDTLSKQMLFTGQTKHTFVWDPDSADWIGRFAKPKPMSYGSCFYTLTLVTTKHGLICWTQGGQLFRFDHDHREWIEITVTGEKLAGSSVDNSTIVYDSKRDRLLLFRKNYGDKHDYDGKMQAVDMATMKVSTLTPKGAAAAKAVPYLCQIRYDEVNDLLLVGGTVAQEAAPDDDAAFAKGASGGRRTPAYDCANDAWITLRIGGDDPSGKRGRNVSLGMMYDAKRKMFWAVDTNSRVYALRLNPATAAARPLGE